MINSSPAEYAFIRVCIFGLQAITPLSIGYTAYYALRWMGLQCDWPILPLPIAIWCAAETLFYVAVQLPLQYTIQKDATHPPLLPKAQRSELFERIIRNVGPADMERHIRWWFRGAPLSSIGREGFKDWLAWAFFEGRIDRDGAAAELKEYTAHFERLLDKTFAEGYGTAVPIRLTLDKIESSTRSLAWYFCVGFVDVLVYVRLCWNDFQHYRQPYSRFFDLFPFRPVALTAREVSPVKHLTYWHRPHTAKNRLPVLFIHGIGIGLYPYVNFLRDLLQHVDEGHNLDEDGGQIGILALEIMPVSFRLTHSALSKQEMCEEINKVLEHHGWDKCVLVGHSYGTVVATHVLHDRVLQAKIASVLLIDPVCFLLHHPDVAYNFTVREPTHANEWQLWYFASQDPGVAHSLGRRFFWSENILWPDDVRLLMQKYGTRMTVSLGARDLIVNTRTVGRYLTGAEPSKDGNWDDDQWIDRIWEGEGLEVLWFEDTDHAQVFDKAEKRARLVGVVRRYCEGVKWRHNGAACSLISLSYLTSVFTRSLDLALDLIGSRGATFRTSTTKRASTISLIDRPPSTKTRRHIAKSPPPSTSFLTMATAAQRALDIPELVENILVQLIGNSEWANEDEMKELLNVKRVTKIFKAATERCPLLRRALWFEPRLQRNYPGGDVPDHWDMTNNLLEENRNIGRLNIETYPFDKSKGLSEEAEFSCEVLPPVLHVPGSWRKMYLFPILNEAQEESVSQLSIHYGIHYGGSVPDYRVLECPPGMSFRGKTVGWMLEQIEKEELVNYRDWVKASKKPKPEAGQNA